MTEDECDRGGIRVLISFGTRLVRETLAIAFEQAGFEVAASLADVAAVKRHCDRQPVDVVVVSPLIPSALHGTPLSIVQDLADAAPHVAIVAVGATSNGEFVRAVLDSGAAGCVYLEDGYGALVDAVRRVHDGDSYVSPTLLDALRSVDGSDGHRLSAREQDVLAFVARGWANVEIARTLNCSLRTIEAERARIAQRLGLLSRSDWVAEALDRGLFS